MTSEHVDQLRDDLYDRVGAIFANTLRGSGHCAVCTSPSAATRCDQCRHQQTTYGDGLADLVVPLAYVRGWMNPIHQSAHHVRRYKHPTQPSVRCRDDLRLMVRAATLLHADCIAATVGSPWDTVTFVPSTDRPGVDHPTVALAQAVAGYQRKKRMLLTIGPDVDASPARWPLPGRFTVDPSWHAAVAGRHVLVVDDTWVSGDKSQSAALALKAAGARAVTVVCIGRWLESCWPEHKALIDRLASPYDPLRCPVALPSCPASS